MIAEKSNTMQELVRAVSANAGKVGYFSDDIISAALTSIEEQGIPTSKVEDYKYCNLDAVFRRDFRQVKQAPSPATNIEKYRLQGHLLLVIMNGKFEPSLSDGGLPDGMSIRSFTQLTSEAKKLIGKVAGPDADPMLALNTAFSGDGAHISVSKDAVIEQPVQLLFISSSELEMVVNPRTLIEVGENASLTITEQFVLQGNGKIFTNYVSERVIGRHGILNVTLLQDQGEKGFEVNNATSVLHEGATLESITVSLSGQLVRNNHQVVLKGRHAVAHLNGLFHAKGTQLIDNHTLMDHQVPDCESNELYKGLASDKSIGVFNGKIFVRRDAQKTNAYQSSKNILLSDDATIDTKPQLEIYADDVKCSHGTSTGKVDETALFYLNARGIGKETARKLLLASFGGEVIDMVKNEPVKNLLMERFEASL